MSCTIEKILTDARTLLERLKEHDTAAESLIDQSAVLHQRVAAMREAGAAGAEKQGQAAAAERADPSRQRPHVLLSQENTQIRDLQQENRGPQEEAAQRKLAEHPVLLRQASVASKEEDTC